MTFIKRKMNALRNLIIPNFTKLIFNNYINKTYLTGYGMEVGPGENPFSTAKETVFLEKFVENYESLFPGAKKDNYISGSAEDIPSPDDSYDFVFSAHCLEHCIDPIKVLKEFERVTKSNGLIFLILPHCNRTFDKGRTISKLEKHIIDYEKEVSKSEYIEESGRHFDVFEEFLEISTKFPRHNWISDAKNIDGSWNKDWIIENGIMHFHVWTQVEIVHLLEYLNYEIVLTIDIMPGRSDSFVVAAKVTK